MTSPGQLVTLDDVRAARELLTGVVRRTPVESFRPLSEALARPALLKCENLQRSGSFKVRGAYVRIARLDPAERARGVVAASAGNHGQGVALAASLLGASATVFMPLGAALPKIAATRGYGSDVRLIGDCFDETLVAAIEHAEQTGKVFIHPFDHPDVIAGQGTIALEVLEQVPDLGALVVGVGGGGLISGIAAAAKALRPDLAVIGVQAAGAAAFPPSLAAGGPQRLTGYATIADGIAVGRPGDLTFAHVRALVDGVVTVEEEEITSALVMLLERGKLVAEPAGVVPIAALLSGVIPAVTGIPTGASALAGARIPTGAGAGDPAPIVAVVSGGNIDPMLLHRVVEHGLTAAGRYLSVTIRCADRPGELARLLAAIANTGANVIGVEHRRYDRRLRLGEVEVNLSVETRGPEHSQNLLDLLRQADYRPARRS